VKKPYRKFWFWLVTLGIGVPAVCVIGYFMTLFTALNNWTNSDNADLKELEQVTGLQFPQDTKLEHCVNTSFQDAFYSARLRMKKSDAKAFIKSVTVSKLGSVRKIETSETHRLGITDNMHSTRWWNPDSAHRYYAIRIESGSVSASNGRLLLMLIAMDDPMWATVYIDYSAD
jgi:hypothetical protein